MSKPLAVDLFAEDYAHEAFLSAMVERLARMEKRTVSLRARSARGGHGRAISELALYQKAVLTGVGGMSVPDLLVVVIDANCTRFNEAKKAIEGEIEVPFRDRTVVACPDPHVERWYLADPESFTQVVGIAPKMGKRKCGRELYKRILSKAVASAGHASTLGGIEFARELVEAMDLYRAGKVEKSLKHLIDDLSVQVKSH
ncbi:MAG: hypothetical protein HY712_02335 [candidate division NC10 bacterium]|nr:hypothetical protein [candidate division NC10 bacterium]